MSRKKFILCLVILLASVEYAYGAKTFVAAPANRLVHMTGFTRPRTVVTISSEEDARCIKVYADVGDAIGRDGIFARLDPTFIDLDIKRNRDRQQANESAVVYYRREVSRYAKLIEQKHAAQTTLDALERDLQNSLEDADALQVEEDILRERKKRHFILAPPGWKVIERYIEPGELVRSGDELAVLGNFNKLLVPLALTPSELLTLREMKKIVVELPELNETVEAYIENISPDYDPSMRKITVDLALRSFPIENRGGIRADIIIPMAEPKGVVSVPASAILEGYGEAFLVRKSGEAVPVMVMGDGAKAGTRRVRSDNIASGDVFLLEPQTTR